MDDSNMDDRALMFAEMTTAEAAALHHLEDYVRQQGYPSGSRVYGHHYLNQATSDFDWLFCTERPVLDCRDMIHKFKWKNSGTGPHRLPCHSISKHRVNAIFLMQPEWSAWHMATEYLKENPPLTRNVAVRTFQDFERGLKENCKLFSPHGD